MSPIQRRLQNLEADRRSAIRGGGVIIVRPDETIDEARERDSIAHPARHAAGGTFFFIYDNGRGGPGQS